MSAAINSTRLHSLFKQMVDLYTPSGKEEELTRFLEQYLAGTGLRVERQAVDDTRANLLISMEHSSREELYLGHIDTVPAYDIEQYEFSEREGICCGLGTADMKGGCAAMIEAFVTAVENGLPADSAVLALVVGEEETGDGTKALLESHRFRSALVAEPTTVQPCNAHYGYVELIVRAFGYRRHAAMSNRDTNAIHALLRYLIGLEDMIEHEQPATVLNIRDLHSGESGFAVPDRCTVLVDLHIPPETDAREYAGGLQAFSEKYLSESSASRYEIEFPLLANGYRLAEDDHLLVRLQQIYRELNVAWQPIAFKSHSDANLLCDAGCMPVILGPGQLAKAHTVDESVAFEQVEAAARIYLRLLGGEGV